MNTKDTTDAVDPAKRVSDLISELRMIAGRSGTEDFLECLLAIDVYALQPLVAGPQPMFFEDAWDELLEVLLKEARKA